MQWCNKGSGSPPDTHTRCRNACALVHSRTFATAAEGGGVGVRMLLPVVDMFNHRGEEVQGLLAAPSKDCDNARCADRPIRGPNALVHLYHSETSTPL